MLQQIDHIGIAVQNLDDTVAFYRDVMGLEVSATEIFNGMKIAFLRIGASELELLEDMTPDGAIARHVAGTVHRVINALTGSAWAGDDRLSHVRMAASPSSVGSPAGNDLASGGRPRASRVVR